MPRPLAVSLLVITTMLWGFAFVAQKSAMDAMGPLTFSAVRYLLGSLAIMPLVLWELKRTGNRLDRREWGVVALIAISFFLGVTLQQIGLTLTTVTNSGFLTSLYVLFVPLLALAVFS
ncbi:MAG: EamA family transporter, partial [Hyphomicrobiales bacterium]